MLAILALVLVSNWPLRAQAVAAFANQVQADLTVLSSEPTLAVWQKSRSGESLELAGYEEGRNFYEVDFTRLNRWCTASIAPLPSQALRAALIYVPSVTPGALPPLPTNKSGALIRACRLQAIWYKAGPGISRDALVSELLYFWVNRMDKRRCRTTLDRDFGTARLLGIEGE